MSGQREYPYNGVISAQIVREAFWKAATATFEDENVHDLEKPYFDEEMDTVDGHMPDQFWEHMARALAEDDDLPSGLDEFHPSTSRNPKEQQ